MDKSQIFLTALPLLTSAEALLLDDTRLVSQISQLQRETGRGGRDQIRKMRGAYDDLANAALGALVYAQKTAKREPGSRPMFAETASGNYQI